MSAAEQAASAQVHFNAIKTPADVLNACRGSHPCDLKGLTAMARTFAENHIAIAKALGKKPLILMGQSHCQQSTVFSDMVIMDAMRREYGHKVM